MWHSWKKQPAVLVLRHEPCDVPTGSCEMCEESLRLSVALCAALMEKQVLGGFCLSQVRCCIKLGIFGSFQAEA